MKKILLVAFAITTYNFTNAQNVHLSNEGWTPFMKNEMLRMLKNTKDVKNLNPVLRDSLCNCYLIGIEKQFPKGMPDRMPYKTQLAITDSCKRKYNILK